MLGEGVGVNLCVSELITGTQKYIMFSYNIIQAETEH